MLKVVQAALDQLARVDWFCHVGEQDTDAVIVLKSWKEALKFSQTRKWSDLQLDAANQYRERLLKCSMERFEEWNKVVDKVKPPAVALVKKKIKQIVSENALPKAFGNAVLWHIVHFCMETAYADVCSPDFYTNQIHWYTLGHFPCGWKGKYPEGKRVIY